MPNLREKILTRYSEAAKVIASYNYEQRLTVNSLESNIQPECEAPKAEEMDSRGMAMQDLLKRQARQLMKLHDCSSCSSSGVDQAGGPDEALLQTRLDDLATTSMSAFYSYRFDLLPYYWRQIYTDTLILISYYSILQAVRRRRFEEHVFDSVVESLDRAIITAGGAGEKLGKPWIEKTLVILEEFWSEGTKSGEERPQKRVKLGRVFPPDEPFGRPCLDHDQTCPRYENWSLEEFENYMNANNGRPRPIVFTDLIKDWPALTDQPWNSPDYLLSKTFGGRRLVPIEIGRSYVDQGWSQELIQFKRFLRRYVDASLGSSPTPDKDTEGNTSQPEKVGYLAQHNLFQQIPSLRNDIQVPDFCWADVPPHPNDSSKDHPKVDVPHLNAWFGPTKTITPLHTDGYHNLLCQVVGSKYVRLYAPWDTKHLRPRGTENGIDMSNTSELDLGVIEGWDPETEQDGTFEGSLEEIRRSLKGVPFWECILMPGDTLVIPIGWWHYVRSLSISFSVSFWWN